jgi:hypothetical protein
MNHWNNSIQNTFVIIKRDSSGTDPFPIRLRLQCQQAGKSFE